MKIQLGESVLVVPDDPKKVTAYQYSQIRIAAAKMATLTNDLPGLRQKISDIADAIKVDNKEVALQQLELLYYSAHLSTMQDEPLYECFAWLFETRPEATDNDIKEAVKSYLDKGLTKEQAENAVGFFLPKLALS